jgi:hypothetical protein
VNINIAASNMWNLEIGHRQQNGDVLENDLTTSIH